MYKDRINIVQDEMPELAPDIALRLASLMCGNEATRLINGHLTCEEHVPMALMEDAGRIAKALAMLREQKESLE